MQKVSRVLNERVAQDEADAPALGRIMTEPVYNPDDEDLPLRPTDNILLRRDSRHSCGTSIGF